ncbi:MAG: NAD(P)H-dependent oxidoreductase [Gammaproteobacteria bacterium]|nr:NAD(P)H-dependent oxidoreductase [Gammaproteobacteria bacterium]
MYHPIIQDLEWRHTVKKYDTSKKVSEEDLQILYEALRLSASSINSQPWKFIVIDSAQARQRLSDSFDGQFPFNQAHVFESTQVILFAYNPYYTIADFTKVVEKGVADQRVKIEDRDKAFAVFSFAEKNTDLEGYTGHWTKAQLYLALGNALHTLARLKIDSTPIEGINVEQVNKEFSQELDGYQCDVALAIGYYHPQQDFNKSLPKSRLEMKDILLKI